MKFVIFIFLMFAEPENERSVLQVDTAWGRELLFQSTEDCYRHIHENYSSLRLFALSYFHPRIAEVQFMLCVPKKTDLRESYPQKSSQPVDKSLELMG